MALIYAFLASLLASGVNFCLRKNLEKQKSAQGYLSSYFLFSLIVSFFFGEVTIPSSFSLLMSSIGTLAGILNFIMMILLAYCVKLGSSGLTFAFQNSASVFPALLLFFLFGESFGFELTNAALVGFGLIILGLFLSTRIEKNHFRNRSRFLKWVALILAVFLIQGTLLVLIQWRTLLFTDHQEGHFLIPWRSSLADDYWFLPGFFFLPTILQLFLFACLERRWISLREFYLGATGGVLNGGATALLFLSTKVAHPIEKMILFPLFSVSVIFLCNLWGRKIYREKIYWPGIVACLLGVLICSLKF